MCAAEHQLWRAVIQLAGSAGIFGFAELGVRARKLEEDLQALLADVTAIESRIAKIGEELRDFLQWAATDPKGDDAALYRAKQQGRNRIEHV